MNARAQLERLFGGAPAPVEAPPKTVPTHPPKERPSTNPPSTDPSQPDDPWRKKDIRPGEEPMKMRHRNRIRAEANEFLKNNDLDEFVK